MYDNIILDCFDMATDVSLGKTEKISQSNYQGLIKTYAKLKKNNTYGKEAGDYITYEIQDDFSASFLSNMIAKDLENMLKGAKKVLIVGIGNGVLISDSLGPKSVGLVEILPSNASFGAYKFIPDVEQNTGIQSVELVSSVVKSLKPSCVIVVDSLASRVFSRIGKSFQLSSAGICPGSGSGGDSSLVLTSKTMGVPVVAIGVPVVVNMKMFLMSKASSEELVKKYNFDCGRNILEDFVVDLNEIDGALLTPKEIDYIIEYSSKIISNAINLFLSRMVAKQKNKKHQKS